MLNYVILILYYLIAIVVIGFYVMPGWYSIRNSWPIRKSHKFLWWLSVCHFIFVMLLVLYSIWYVVLSEGWDTNGLVIGIGFIFTPIITIPFTLGTYFLLLWYARSIGVWQNAKS